MDLIIFILPALLVLFFIPAIIELFRRKDKGPRGVPEQTIYEAPPVIESPEQEEETEREEEVTYTNPKATFSRIVKRVVGKKAPKTVSDNVAAEKVAVTQTTVTQATENVQEAPPAQAASRAAAKESVPVDQGPTPPMMEKARQEARVKVVIGDMTRVTGDITIPEGSIINNSLVVEGKLRIGKGAHIYGSVKAFRGVDTGEYVEIDGHVLSEGPIKIGKYSIINGVVDSTSDIFLDENAMAESVSTPKAIVLKPGAKVNKRITSGQFITSELPERPPAVPVEPVKPFVPEPVAPAIMPPIQEVDLTPKPEKVAPPSTPTIIININSQASKVVPTAEGVDVVEKEKEPEKLEEEEELPPQPVTSVSEEKVEISKQAREVSVSPVKTIPFEFLDPEVDHLFIYAPTRYGKTFLVKNYVVPALAGKKKIVVIDPHREYPFDKYYIKYEKTIPDVESDLFKTFITFNIWADVDSIVKDAIAKLRENEGNLAIVPNILDSNVERLIISEFLKRLTQAKWAGPILLLVEEADKYDVTSLVTRGRHANIQAVLISAKKLLPEVFSNAHLVLGSINPVQIADYDMDAARAVAELGKYEFLWEKEYHDWRRFRIGSGSIPTIRREPVETPEEVRHEETRYVFAPQIPASAPVPLKEQREEGKERPAAGESKGTITDKIFEFLEDRIRDVENSKKVSLNGNDLSKMSETEVKVIKLRAAGYDMDQIGLSLLMDPVQVQEILHSLMEKGYLDEYMNPTKPVDRKEPGPTPTLPRKSEMSRYLAEEAENGARRTREMEESLKEIQSREMRIKNLEDELRAKKLEENHRVKKLKEELDQWRGAAKPPEAKQRTKAEQKKRKTLKQDETGGDDPEGEEQEKQDPEDEEEKGEVVSWEGLLEDEKEAAQDSSEGGEQETAEDEEGKSI